MDRLTESPFSARHLQRVPSSGCFSRRVSPRGQEVHVIRLSAPRDPRRRQVSHSPLRDPPTAVPLPPDGDTVTVHTVHTVPLRDPRRSVTVPSATPRPQSPLRDPRRRHSHSPHSPLRDPRRSVTVPSAIRRPQSPSAPRPRWLQVSLMGFTFSPIAENLFLVPNAGGRGRRRAPISTGPGVL